MCSHQSRKAMYYLLYEICAVENLAGIGNVCGVNCDLMGIPMPWESHGNSHGNSHEDSHENLVGMGWEWE